MGNFEKFQNDLTEASTEDLREVADLLALYVHATGQTGAIGYARTLEEVMDELRERAPLFDKLVQSHWSMLSTLAEESDVAEWQARNLAAETKVKDYWLEVQTPYSSSEFEGDPRCRMELGIPTFEEALDRQKKYEAGGIKATIHANAGDGATYECPRSSQNTSAK